MENGKWEMEKEPHRDVVQAFQSSPATRQLVEPLLYQDGDILHFADAAA
jgi:hypothetical protein